MSGSHQATLQELTANEFPDSKQSCEQTTTPAPWICKGWDLLVGFSQFIKGSTNINDWHMFGGWALRFWCWVRVKEGFSTQLFLLLIPSKWLKIFGKNEANPSSSIIFLCNFTCTLLYIYHHSSPFAKRRKFLQLCTAQPLPVPWRGHTGPERGTGEFTGSQLEMFHRMFLCWLSQWQTFKLLGIIYLIGKIKFKLLFHGPLAE